MKTVCFITLIVLISLLQFSHATKYQLGDTCCPGCSYSSSCCCAPIHTSIKHVTMTGIPPSMPPMPPGKIPRQLLPNHLCPVCPANVKLSSTGTKYCCKPKRHVTVTSTVWISPRTTKTTSTSKTTQTPTLFPSKFQFDCNSKLSSKSDLSYTLNHPRGFALRAMVDLSNSSLTWTNCSWKTTLNRTPKFITFSLISLKRSNLDFILQSLTLTNPSIQPMTLLLNNLTIPLSPNSSQSISPSLSSLQSFTIKRQDQGKLFVYISNIQISLDKPTTSTTTKTTKSLKSIPSSTKLYKTTSIRQVEPSSKSTSKSTTSQVPPTSHSTSRSNNVSTSQSTSHSTSQSTSTDQTTSSHTTLIHSTSSTQTTTTNTTLTHSTTSSTSSTIAIVPVIPVPVIPVPVIPVIPVQPITTTTTSSSTSSTSTSKTSTSSSTSTSTTPSSSTSSSSTSESTTSSSSESTSSSSSSTSSSESTTSTTTSSTTTSSTTTSSTTSTSTIAMIPNLGLFTDFIAYNVTPSDTVQDSLGNVYTVGSFEGTVNFGSFSFTGPMIGQDAFYNDIGSTTGFLAKISNNGTYDWVKTFTGTVGTSQVNYFQANLIKLMPDGNLSVAIFAATAFTIDTITIPPDNSIVKFSPNGQALSTFSLEGFFLDDLVYDNDGNFYIAASGMTASLNQHGITASGQSILIAKIWANNSMASWYRNIAGQFSYTKLLLDNDRLYIGSTFSGAASYNFNGVSLTATAYGQSNNFFAAWSSLNGNNIWAKSTPAVGTYNSATVTQGNTYFVNFYQNQPGGNLNVLCYYQSSTFKVNNTFTLYSGTTTSNWFRGVQLTVTPDGNIIDAWQAQNTWDSVVRVGSEIYGIGRVYNAHDLQPLGSLGKDMLPSVLYRYASNGTKLSTTYTYERVYQVKNFGNNLLLVGYSEFGLNRNMTNFSFGPWNSTLTSQAFIARLTVGQV